MTTAPATLRRQLVPRLGTLWRRQLRAWRQALPLASLTAALEAPHDLDVEQLLTTTWQQVVHTPVALHLAALAADTWAALPQAPPGVQAPLRVAQDAYIQGQLALVWRTTLLAIRQELHRSRALDLAPSARARALARMLGLTPRQATQVEGAPRFAYAMARAQRVQGLAEAQAVGLVEAGRLAVQQQQPHAGAVRRTWQLDLTERTCDVCTSTAALNAGGVDLWAPFVTPLGPVWEPPMHPYCRCGVAYYLENT